MGLEMVAAVFSPPKDFTPVCTSELECQARIEPKFASGNTTVVGLPADETGTCEGFIAATSATARSVFVVEPDKKTNGGCLTR